MSPLPRISARRSSRLALFLGFCTTLTATLAAQAPFLWTVEGKGLKPATLFGTIHLTDPKVTTLAPPVEQAFAKADAVFIEVPTDPELQAELAVKTLLPEGKNLKDLLPPDVYQKLDGMFTAKGIPFAAMGRFKVWVIAVQLPMLDKIMDFLGKQPLDMAIYDRAGKEGKKRGGIETAEEQLAVFESLTAEEQLALLTGTIEAVEKYWKEKRSPLDAVLEAYLSGDEAKVMAVLAESYDPKAPLNKKLWKLLIDDRNVRMAERIGQKLREQPGQAFFFGVGCGHLLGDNGVANLLRKQGFTVTRADSPAK